MWNLGGEEPCPSHNMYLYLPIASGLMIQATVVGLVGVRGFEPPTSCTPCRRANRTAPHPDSTRVPLYHPFLGLTREG